LVTREFHDPHGTVGAVALDRRGGVAAATSTGGTQDKEPGRVGDTAIPGAGTWADDRLGAASCTGWGEAILRTTLARVAVEALRGRRAPVTAGSRAIDGLARVRGHAGVILVDTTGRAAAAFNTPRMARGIATEGRGPRVAVGVAERRS
jgi:beta-aspartyl-peptidase (threonine type)